MKIPKYVSEQYPNGAHGFRAEKRKQVRSAIKAVDALMFGCAYFPRGQAGLAVVSRLLEEIKKDLRVDNFGR